LAKLLRLCEGAAREAVRLVLVDGMSISSASETVLRRRREMEPVRVAAGNRV
jgi:hypothetical protein